MQKKFVKKNKTQLFRAVLSVGLTSIFQQIDYYARNVLVT